MLLVGLAFGVIFAQLGVFGLNSGQHFGLALVALGQFARHGYRARGVQHVNNRAGVVRVDLHGGVDARSRGPADEQRHGHSTPFHFLSDTHHLVERRRDQSRQADNVHVMFLGGGQDFVGGYHHAKVDNFIAVAAQYHAHDIFTNVVHIAFDGRHQDFTDCFGFGAFVGFYVRLEVRHGFFHHPCRLNHLWQEHFALAEQVAHDAHAVHQRPFDHFQRAVK